MCVHIYRGKLYFETGLSIVAHLLINLLTNRRQQEIPVVL